MRIITQISVFLINAPGRLATLTHALAKAKVNVVALTLMDSAEHGVLRLIADEPGRALKVLERLGFQVSTTDVLEVEMPNRPGSLATVAQALAEAHINIDYAYATSGAPGGHTLCVFKVPYLRKSIEALEKALPALKGKQTRAVSAK